MTVTVVGAGIIGLTTALRLRDAGHEVRVTARELPDETTSSVAAAMWAAYRVSHPRVREWAEVSFHEFTRQSTDPDTGVLLRWGVEVFPHPAPKRWWPGPEEHLRGARPDELPEGATHGWVYRVPVIEMPPYLDWLQRRLGDLGVAIERADVHALTEPDAEVVVNCSGLGARELAEDHSVHPVQGQVVRIARNGIERFVLDEFGPGGLTYVIPRAQDCICGGTAVPDGWSLEADPDVAGDILRRCAVLEPRVASAEVFDHRVGLRPGRAEVRLELSHLPDGRPVIHNYGHGGSGVTLAWGCAEDVVRLVTSSLPGR